MAAMENRDSDNFQLIFIKQECKFDSNTDIDTSSISK